MGSSLLNKDGYLFNWIIVIAQVFFFQIVNKNCIEEYKKSCEIIPFFITDLTNKFYILKSNHKILGIKYLYNNINKKSLSITGKKTAPA